MAFNPKPIMEKLRSFLAASARFPGGTGIGEPKAPPTSAYASVILGPITLTEPTAGGATSGRIDLIVRIYRDAINEPLEDTEFLMATTVLELFEDFCGDFDFGDANVRNLLPLDMAATPGYQTIGNTLYRVMDITVPLMVNDMTTMAK